MSHAASDAPFHFSEDGVEFNQIGSNLAMICRKIAPRSRPDRDRTWVNLQQRRIAPFRLKAWQNTPKSV
jgi:hypothetical protein